MSDGFRFGVADAAVLVAGAAAVWGLWPAIGSLALLPAVVVGHFFLFCNVFRVRRSAELVWAAVFAVNFVAWLISGHFTWLGVLGLQTPVTLLLLLREIRSPTYHGIFSARD